MRLPRMTTRRWMVVIVVIGLSLAGWQTERHRRTYRDRANLWERRELRHTIELMFATGAVETSGCIVEFPDDFDPMAARIPVAAERYRRGLVYARQMRRKYEFAARHPWLPVEPDPPEPE